MFQLVLLACSGPDTLSRSDFDLCVAFFSGPPPFLFLLYVFTELGNISAGKCTHVGVLNAWSLP